VTQEESILGWLRIAVDLGTVKFSAAGSGPNEHSKDERKRTAQSSCGHGSILSENTVCHSDKLMNEGVHSILGMNPSEVAHNEEYWRRYYSR